LLVARQQGVILARDVVNGPWRSDFPGKILKMGCKIKRAVAKNIN
jgi:hypothetical protein